MMYRSEVSKEQTKSIKLLEKPGHVNQKNSTLLVFDQLNAITKPDYLPTVDRHQLQRAKVDGPVTVVLRRGG
jgi:hypothetical protein